MKNAKMGGTKTENAQRKHSKPERPGPGCSGNRTSKRKRFQIIRIRKGWKKKKSYLKIFMVPMCMVVLLQGLLPFLTLIVGGVRTRFEKSVISMDSHIVENQSVILQNDMVEKWRSVSRNSSALSTELLALLDREEADMDAFLASEELQQKFLQAVFEEMTDALHYNYASGLFLILANDSPILENADYCGFFIRDSDPKSSTYSDTDLLLERGSKKLVKNHSIALDSAWSSKFHFQGEGKRDADAFFYEPYTAALAYPDADPDDLGYWAKPFILEDSDMDTHKMITYSVPLVCEGTVYGVLGVEISISYLSSYFSVSELDSGLNAGYVLAIDQGDGNYKSIAGSGALFAEAAGEGDGFSLVKTENSLIQTVEGKQTLCAFVSPLDIWGSNAPYEDTDWVLVGFVTEKSVYGLGRQIYFWMLASIFAGLTLAVLLVFFLTKRSVAPIAGLMKSVQGGAEAICSLPSCGITEIDALHEVIETLTNSQLRNEAQLLEEKERYRIAVESTSDLFFTFYPEENVLEIVNSHAHDGSWDCLEHPFLTGGVYVFPEDQKEVETALFQAEEKIELEFRMRINENEPYEWVSLTGTVFPAAGETRRRIVGCVHNIHQRKLLEQAQKKKLLQDEVTGFYRSGYGLEQIGRSAAKEQKGVLVLLDVVHFMHIYKQYGLLFGDILLEQLANLLLSSFTQANLEHTVCVRVGTDQFLLWLGQAKPDQAQALLETAQEDFRAFIDPAYLSLRFRCAFAKMDCAFLVQQGVAKVRAALYAAKCGGNDFVWYEELSEEARGQSDKIRFKKNASVGRIRELSLSSLALNLLDRSDEAGAALAVLSLKLKERYHMRNLLITRFDRETLSSTVTYFWKKETDGRSVVRCSERDYQNFLQKTGMQELKLMVRSREEEALLGPLPDRADGLMFHMMDNASYCGSLLFPGADAAILDGEEGKQFYEIASIIQNRINLKRHDRSAQAKADFLTRMSHEIRTPMNGIIGMTEIALRKGQTEERRIDCLKKISDSSAYLLGLINDILDMSKIESGKLTLVQGPFDMHRLLESLLTLMEPRFQKKQQNFTTEVSLVHSGFVGDELRISQILVNLLSNACKYTPQGGRICLTVQEGAQEEEKKELRFAVCDNGIGIAKEKQQLIFQRFEQADDSRNARTQGTGLGLAISSRLVHMMDSEILLESEPGRGSTFSFTLRLAAAEPDKTQEAQTEEPDLSRKRILVAEDNELNMEITCSILQEYGAATEGARDGKQAVNCVLDHPPGFFDLIFMDIQMPVMDGLAAARAIRGSGRPDLEQIPIIAMSANAFDDDVKRSLASGMNAHLSKPVNMQALRQTLNRFLK